MANLAYPQFYCGNPHPFHNVQTCMISYDLTPCISGSSPQTFYSLDVIASDGGLPSLTDVTTVQINVTRNNNRPVWRVSNNANITILETQPLSESIGSVSVHACLLMLW